MFHVKHSNIVSRETIIKERQKMKRFYFGNGNTITESTAPESVVDAMISYVSERGVNTISDFYAIYDDNYFSLFDNGSLVKMGKVTEDTSEIFYLEFSIAACNEIAGKEGEMPSLIAYAIGASEGMVLVRFRDRFHIADAESVDFFNPVRYGNLKCYAYGFIFPEVDGRRYTLKDYYRNFSMLVLEDGNFIDVSRETLYRGYDLNVNGRVYTRYFRSADSIFKSDLTGDYWVVGKKRTLQSGECIANVYNETCHIIRCEHCGKETLSYHNSGLCHSCYDSFPHSICPICGNETVEESGYHRDCITRVGGYHDSHEYERTFYTDGDSSLCFGVENELKFGTQFNRDTYLKAMRGEFGEMFHFERDGSLSGVSCETISEPMDLDYFLNNKIWMRVANNIRKGHGRHDRETGCHIHISREAFNSDDAITAYLLMMNNAEVYDILTTGSGRDRHNTNYHARYRYNIRDCDIDDFNSHSYCFTVSADTVECRCYEAFTSGIQYKRVVLVTLGMVQVANSLESDLDKAANMDSKTLYGLLKVWRRDAATAFKTFAERAGKNTREWA